MPLQSRRRGKEAAEAGAARDRGSSDVGARPPTAARGEGSLAGIGHHKLPPMSCAMRASQTSPLDAPPARYPLTPAVGALPQTRNFSAAFEPTPPFAVVAVSAPFCWPDASVTSPGLRLRTANRTYPCPTSR